MDADRRANEGRGRGNRIFSLLFVVGVLALAIVGVFALLKTTEHGLAEIEVASIDSVEITHQLRDETFSVQRQTWSRLLQNFESSHFTANTTRLIEMATITFQMKDGQQKIVTVYETGKKPGCFRVGRLYYIGGDERKLSRLMDDEIKRHKTSAQ